MFTEFEREVNDATSQEFAPLAEYDDEGDCIEFFADNVAFNAVRLDEWVTMYIAESDGRMIGCLIKRIRKLLSEGLQEIVVTQDNKMRLDYFFVAQAASTQDQAVAHKYNELRHVSEDVKVAIPCAA